MAQEPDILEYTAFSDDPAGGNPAGVVLDASGLDDAEMQAIATRLDHAETAFVTGEPDGDVELRYFSPIAEVPFCGHATIATAVALAERRGAGLYRFRTAAGPIAIETRTDGGPVHAAFTSVDPVVEALPEAQLRDILALIGLGTDALDPERPPRIANAGNPHPVVVLRDAADFDGFAFDPAAARRLLDADGWPATIAVLHAAGDGVYEARNLFPVGRITEDPATGSAAAAVGGYLRALGLVAPPARVEIRQGRHVGRPGTLVVDIPPSGGITVSGTAVPLA